MTWKEFKDEAEEQGMKDEDKIWYIDVPDMDRGFECRGHDDLGVAIV